MKEFKSDKHKVTFKAPADTKDGGTGESFSWKTMQIIVEGTLPISKEEDLVKTANPDTIQGVKMDSATVGDLFITTYQEKQGPAHAVCGKKGTSVDMRISFEPQDKNVGLAICKSFKIE